jgi:hypothetical protein
MLFYNHHPQKAGSGLPDACQARRTRTWSFGMEKGSTRMRTWRNVASAALAVALVFVSTGCAYMHVQMPMGSNFDNTQLGSKEGRASSYSVLWLVAWGNSGTKAAATQGDIKIIRCADTEVKCVLLGIYSRVTTVVYGD